MLRSSQRQLRGSRTRGPNANSTKLACVSQKRDTLPHRDLIFHAESLQSASTGSTGIKIASIILFSTPPPHRSACAIIPQPCFRTSAGLGLSGSDARARNVRCRCYAPATPRLTAAKLPRPAQLLLAALSPPGAHVRILHAGGICPSGGTPSSARHAFPSFSCCSSNCGLRASEQRRCCTAGFRAVEAPLPACRISPPPATHSHPPVVASCCGLAFGRACVLSDLSLLGCRVWRIGSRGV